MATNENTDLRSTTLPEGRRIPCPDCGQELRLEAGLGLGGNWVHPDGRIFCDSFSGYDQIQRQ